MKQIEIEIYRPHPEKPGYLKLERNKTIVEVYDELVPILKEQGVYDELDYFTISGSWQDEREFPNYRWIACFAVEGGNEGHYIHVEAISNADGEFQREIVFLGKTFCGLDYALKVANVCTKSFYR